MNIFVYMDSHFGRQF